MSKLSDTLKAALDKKKGIHHPENDGTPAVETKKKVKIKFVSGNSLCI